MEEEKKYEDQAEQQQEDVTENQEITETDVDLAAASGAVIVGFNTSMASGAKRAADANGVDVRDYEVIYKLLEDNDYQFIYDKSKSIEDCKKSRDKKQQPEKDKKEE